MSADAPPPATDPTAGSASKPRSRGMVCPACGKYHDISARPAGQTFDCACGRSLTVPHPAPVSQKLPAEKRLRIIELRRTRRWGRVAMIVGFVLTIVLASAALHLMFREERYGSGACAAVMAIGFLVAATIAVNEMRRASAELAAEESGGEV